MIAGKTGPEKIGIGVPKTPAIARLVRRGVVTIKAAARVRSALAIDVMIDRPVVTEKVGRTTAGGSPNVLTSAEAIAGTNPVSRTGGTSPDQMIAEVVLIRTGLNGRTSHVEMSGLATNVAETDIHPERQNDPRKAGAAARPDNSRTDERSVVHTVAKSVRARRPMRPRITRLSRKLPERVPLRRTRNRSFPKTPRLRSCMVRSVVI